MRESCIPNFDVMSNKPQMHKSNTPKVVIDELCLLYYFRQKLLPISMINNNFMKHLVTPL